MMISAEVDVAWPLVNDTSRWIGTGAGSGCRYAGIGCGTTGWTTTEGGAGGASGTATVFCPTGAEPVAGWTDACGGGGVICAAAGGGGDPCFTTELADTFVNGGVNVAGGALVAPPPPDLGAEAVPGCWVDELDDSCGLGIVEQWPQSPGPTAKAIGNVGQPVPSAKTASVIAVGLAKANRFTRSLSYQNDAGAAALRRVLNRPRAANGSASPSLANSDNLLRRKLAQQKCAVRSAQQK